MTNEEIYETLDRILPVVNRAHGKNHPELHKVLALYNKIRKKPLAKYFLKIEKLTNNYSVPEDACATFEKAYNLLSILDNNICAEN